MDKSSKTIVVALIAALVVVSGSFAAFAYSVFNAPKVTVGNEIENEFDVIAPVADDNSAPSYLYVQNADSGTLAKQDGTYKLTLKGVSSTTVSFTDRPDRAAAKITTHEFIQDWSVGIDSFAADPPNAALVIYEGNMEETLVLELQHPVYANGTLQYDVSFLNSNGVVSTKSHGTLEPEGQIPDSFARVALFIDNSLPSYCSGTVPAISSSVSDAEAGAYGAGYNAGFENGEECVAWGPSGGDPQNPPSYCSGIVPAISSSVSDAEAGAYGAGYNAGFENGEDCMAYQILHPQ